MARVVTKLAPSYKKPSIDRSQRVQSAATTGLFVLALFYAADVAAPVIIPTTIGFLLSMILATPVRRLVALHIPRPLASAMMILLVLACVSVPIYLLSEPAAEWMKNMPRTASELTERIRTLTLPIQDVREAAEEVEKLTTQFESESDSETTVVKVEAPGFMQTLLDGAPRLVASGLFAIFLAHLLLCSGDAMLRKIISMVCNMDDQRRSMVITRQIQADLFRYLSAVTMINLGLGIATAVALFIMDVPNALLWGGMAGLFNYAPLVGPVITIAVLTVVGMTTFEPMGSALMVPFVYFILTNIEAQVISPSVIGRRLALSPVVVLIALVGLGWLWGIAGLLLAVPIVSSARIIFTNIPQLDRVAVLLGR